MIAALALLLVFQFAGEVTVRALGLPVPGPVIGMGLFFVWLLLRDGPGEETRQLSLTLLQHLSLLFIPAGTGIVLYGDLIAREWLPLAAAVLGSTVLAIVVTALVLSALLKRRAGAPADHGDAR